MKHNPYFINGYPAVCPNEGNEPFSENKDKSSVLLWEALIVSTYKEKYHIGYKCTYCGVKWLFRDFLED